MSEERIRMRDMIILLPGITGSILQKNGRDIWSPSTRVLLSTITSLGENLQAMNLYWDDPSVDDLGDGIKAVGLIQDAVLIPGLVKIDGYTKLSGMVQGCFDVTKGSLNPEDKPQPPANYFEFPYDWRRDNRLAARWLKDLIDLRLPQWREHAGEGAKVILVAHSMGGIVARHYLEVLGGWEDCKALITFGTPFRGSVKSLDFLANGCRRYFVDLGETVRTFTSVYQLLPTYEVVRTNDGCRKVADLEIAGVDRNKAREALDFHQTIMNRVDERRGGGNTDPYVIFPVLGTYQPTIQSAELYDGVLTVGEALPPNVDSLLGHGDGTVPYLSAIPHELSRAYRTSFFAECHAALQCNSEVLNFVYDQLQDLQVEGLENLRGPAASPSRQRRAAISLYTRDLWVMGEPVELRARILEGGRDLMNFDKYREHMAFLLAEIEPVGGGTAHITIAFQQRDNEWLLAHEGLPPGLYRVEVHTAKAGPLAPPPVHDLFQVAAA